MNPTQLSALLVELLSLPTETEWVEWKHNNDNPDMIAERISALANSAVLHGRDFGYMVWGVEDGTKKVVGTTFRPRLSKKGNEELENWMMRSQHPQVNFQMHEWLHQGVPMVLLQIPRAGQAPVRFGSEEYISVLVLGHPMFYGQLPFSAKPARQLELTFGVERPGWRWI